MLDVLLAQAGRLDSLIPMDRSLTLSRSNCFIHFAMEVSLIPHRRRQPVSGPIRFGDLDRPIPIHAGVREVLTRPTGVGLEQLRTLRESQAAAD